MNNKVTLWKGKLLGDLSDDELRKTVGFTLTWKQAYDEQVDNELQEAVGFVPEFVELVTDEQAREVYAEAKWRKLYDNRSIAPDDPLLVADDAVKKALGIKITITAEMVDNDVLF